jgi:hypothetical protein
MKAANCNMPASRVDFNKGRLQWRQEYTFTHR